MKFKSIFILFNIVIVVSFLIIYFMPLFMLGWEYTAIFWKRNWFLPVIFIGVLALLNTYFLLNWRLFQLLESEDWDRLTEYLEERIFNRKKLQAQHVKLLINAYLIRSKIEKMEQLENFIRNEKPSLLPRFALQLGVPYLLKNDSEKMIDYFGEFRDNTRGEDNNWIQWNYAFGLLLQQRRGEAKEILINLTERAKEPVLQLLTVHLLEVYGDEPEIRTKIDQIRGKLKAGYTRAQWENEKAKAKNNIQVIVLSKLLDEATEKLFAEGPEKGENGGQDNPTDENKDEEGWNEIH